MRRAGLDTPFVGRADDVRRFLEGVRRALDGQPSGWLVSGDAGVGKSRYLREVARRSEELGAHVVVGHCVDLGAGGLPYLPFAEVVGQLAAADDLARLPALAPLAGGRSGAGDGEDGGDRRLPLFDAVRRLLADCGERSGAVVVIFEDIHWADQSSRDLLHFLLARLRDERLVLAASYRTDDLHRRHPLRRVLADIVRLPVVERVELRPFDARELSDYLAALLGAPVDEATLSAVLARSEGNAYFAEELVACDEGRGDALPAALSDVLLSRVERLTPPAQQITRVASVAGRRVTDALLGSVSGLAPDEIENAVREAVAQLVLVPVGSAAEEPGYGFRHALMREAVYEDLLPRERVRLHAAYATALAGDDVGKRRGLAAAVAHHAMAAHDLPLALTASVRAATDASAAQAPAEALVHLEHALTVWDAVPSAEALAGVDQITLVLRAASAATDAGEQSRAVALASDAVALARQIDDESRTAVLVRCLMQLALQLYVVDRDVESVGAAQEAMDLLAGEPLSELTAHVAAVHARALAGAPTDAGIDDPLEAARRSADVARTAALDLGLDDVESDALITLALVDDATGDTAAAGARLLRARDLAHTAGHHATELRAEFNLASVRYYAGDVTGALAPVRRAIALADRTGLTWSAYGLESRVLYVVAQYVAGDWAASRSAARLAGRQPPDAVAARLATAELYALVASGNATAQERVAELKGAWHHDGQIALVAGGAGADELLWSGEPERAVDEAQAAIAYVSKTWGEWYLGGIWLAALALAALADLADAERLRGGGVSRDCLDRGRALVDDARERFRRGRPRAARPGPEARAWLARAEAEWTRLQGVHDVDVWRTAVDAFDYGYPYEQARGRWRLAEALVATGERDAAGREVSLALETAHALGAAPLVAAVTDLARRSRLDLPVGTSATRARPPAPDTLTPREREVLALLADGRTNSQIGRALYISPKTASVHVSNLITKLGASGRTEVVALAYQRGLLERFP